MNVPSIYLMHNVGFSGAFSEAISSQFSMYIFAISGDNGEPIVKSFSCWYISDLEELCLYTEYQLFYTVIYQVLVRSPRDGSIPVDFEPP